MTTTYCFSETAKISDIIDMSSDSNTYVGLENKAGSEIDPLCEMCTLEWHDPKPEDLVMIVPARISVPGTRLGVQYTTATLG